MNAPIEPSAPQIDPRVSLRPTIDTSKSAQSTAEQFQNDVLYDGFRANKPLPHITKSFGLF